MGGRWGIVPYRGGSAVEGAACLARWHNATICFFPVSAPPLSALPAHAIDHRVGRCGDARVGDGLAGGAAAVVHLIGLAARDGGCAAWLDGHQGGSK